MKHIAIMVLGVMALETQGQILAAEYRFNPPTAGTTAPFFSNPLVLSSASNFSPGPGLTGSVGFTQGAGLNGSDKAYWADRWTLSSSVDLTDYFSFTLNPLPGYLLGVDSITFWERRSATGPAFWQLRPGPPFASAIGFGPTTTAVIGLTPFGKRKITPAGLNFAIPMELRMYGYSATNNAGTWRIDSVHVYVHIITPVPIELISFDGKQVGKDVELTWSTATEKDNDYFTIYRSNDAENWEEVAHVDGAGDSQTRRDYELRDNAAQNGVNFYKLRQTDYDGLFEEFKIVPVEFREMMNLTEQVGSTFGLIGTPTRLVDYLGRTVSGLAEQHFLGHAGIFFLVDDEGRCQARIQVTN